MAEARYTDTVREDVKVAREEEEEVRDRGRRSMLLTRGLGSTQTRCVRDVIRMNFIAPHVTKTNFKKRKGEF